MIKFRKVRWKNFLSTGNYFNEIQLDRSPTTLVMGTNGAGKSTIIEAIVFALYGKSFRGSLKNNLVNNKSNKKCIVEIEFDIGKKEYKVVRGIKPTVFEIYVDGKKLLEDSKRPDQQKFLEEEILKFSLTSCKQVIILGTANYKPFMELSTPERRTFQENFLGIEIVGQMYKLALVEIKDLKKQIRQTEAAIDKSQEVINVLKKVIKDNTAANNLNKETINKEIASIKSRAVNNKQRLEELKKTESSLSEKMNSLHKVLNLNIESEIRIVKRELTRLRTEKDNPVGGLCDRCGQEVSTERVSEINKDLEKQIDEQLLQLNALQQAQDDNDEIEEELLSLDKQQRSVENQIENLKRSIIDDVSRMKSLATKLNVNVVDISDSQKRMSEEVDALKKHRKNLSKIKEELTVVDTASKILKDDGIRSHIIKQYLPMINKQVNKYLDDLNMNIVFHLDSNFDETIKRGMNQMKYSDLSEGEKMRVNLATMFAWRDVAKSRSRVHTNLLFLDETFDSSLDGDGTDDLIRLIDETNQGYNVFVISHKGDALYDKFRSVITFDTKKSFSYIV